MQLYCYWLSYNIMWIIHLLPYLSQNNLVIKKHHNCNYIVLFCILILCYQDQFNVIWVFSWIVGSLYQYFYIPFDTRLYPFLAFSVSVFHDLRYSWDMFVLFLCAYPYYMFLWCKINLIHKYYFIFISPVFICRQFPYPTIIFWLVQWIIE